MSDPHTANSPRTLVVATGGHVDHGKTSLVKALSGTDTDTLREEKSRGLTINLGYAYAHWRNQGGSDLILGFVDVPGHSDFINNMLAGVGAVECALMVVAADDGIMPQTREHLDIIKLLGIRRGVIAITKVDRSDERQVQRLSQEIKSLVAGTALAQAPIIPVSSVTGTGLDLVKAALIDQAGTPLDLPAAADQYCRFLIDRSFTVKGIGTVVTGTVIAGHLQAGQTVSHSRTSESTRVRGMRLHNTALEHVSAGQRAALNINLDYQRVHRGDWLLDPALLNPVTRFDCKLKLLDPDAQIRASAEYHLHLGASHHIVNLRSLADPALGIYQIKTGEPVYLQQGDRFIVRDPAGRSTLGGGEVLDQFVPRRQRDSEQRIAELQAMDQPPLPALQALLRQAQAPMDLHRFAVNRNLRTAAVQSLLEELAAQGIDVARLDSGRELPLLLPAARMQALQETVTRQLADFHHNHPNKQGMSELALMQALPFKGPAPVFHAIVEYLLDNAGIQRSGTLLHLPGHQAHLSEAEEKFMASIRPLLLEAGTVPPRTRELVDLTGIPLPPLEQILKEMAKAGQLVRVAANRYFLPETLSELADFTEQLAEQHEEDGFTVIQFRDASGIGRNLCIEILEYFDSIGFTRRQGNMRILRTNKANVFDT